MKKSQIFNEVPVKRPKSNLFDLSHEVKMTGKMGLLIPILCQDTVPGDRFTDTTEIMVRFEPMLKPIMHRVDVTTHTFFVPNRLVWNTEWEDFITGGREGDAEPIPPYVTTNQIAAAGAMAFVQESQMWDYFGLKPTTFENDTPISSLPFRCYSLIYNEYYRDQNLDPGWDTPQTSGLESLGDIPNIMALRFRAFEKDYFTSALPWTQRGADVLIPMDGIAQDADITYFASSFVKEAATGNNATGVLDANAGILRAPAGTGARVENIDEIRFSNAEITINDLRRSIKLQEWLEANARGGARYTEQIYVHFGVKVPDYRLQRPEYLGGGKQPVVISEVRSTAANTAEDNGQVGDLAGYGLSMGRQNKWAYTCSEHGWIITLLSVMPRTAYQDGIPRKFQRQNKFDYFWKEFANIGEQAIKNSELFFSESEETNDLTFGYTPRYAEYKFENDRVAGAFRTSLSYWHLGRQFDTLPTLSSAFVRCRAFLEDFNRIFYVTSDVDNLQIQVFHHLKARRPMPYFGVPSI